MPLKKYQPRRSKDDRAYVYRFTKGTCYYCGVELPKSSRWAVEHQQPRSRNGLDNGDNVAPACSPCNSRKGKSTPDEFKKYIAELIYWKLDKVFDAVDIQECYGVSKTKLNRLRKAIKRAMDAARDIDTEIQSRPWPGEALIQEFVKEQAEWSDKFFGESETERSSN
jgi:hypothetical protein